MCLPVRDMIEIVHDTVKGYSIQGRQLILNRFKKPNLFPKLRAIWKASISIEYFQSKKADQTVKKAIQGRTPWV